METIGKILLFAGRIILFGIVSIVFLPAFLLVHLLQQPWNDLMKNLFNL